MLLLPVRLPQTEICLEEEHFDIYPELSLVMRPRVLFVTHLLLIFRVHMSSLYIDLLVWILVYVA